MSEQPNEIRVAGTPLGRKRHICAFFHSTEEEYQVLVPFIKEGIERSERAFHIVDPAWRPEHLRRLSAAGIDADAGQRTGQVEVRPWADAYLYPGHFDQGAMLRLIEEVLQDGHVRGFPLTRLWANMEWALESLPGVDDLVEYETRLNYLLPSYDDPVVCTYDLTRFSAGVVIDILRTHPMVLIGGIVQENPYFVPPDQFLAELRERNSVAPA